MIFHCFLWPNQKRPVENQDSKWITINVTGIQGQHILSQIITFGGTSFSCLSQELWSNLSSRLVMRGGGAGVSDVGSEFCRGIGGRWGDRPSWKAETPWEDWSCSDWDPVMEGPWDFTETRCAIWKENSEVSVCHNTSVSLKTDQEVPEALLGGAWEASGPAVCLHCWRTLSGEAGRGRKYGWPLCAGEPESSGGSVWSVPQPDRQRGS